MTDAMTHPCEQVQVLGQSLEAQRIAGNAAKGTIVFLHEGLGSVAMWRSFPAQVCAATGCAGLVYSRQGYGQSSPAARPLLPTYMHYEAWEVLPALLAQLGIDQPILLGHSDGGTIALLYASRFATRSCIVMAPHLFVEDVSLRSIAAARVAYETGDLRGKLAKFHNDVDGAFWQWNDVWLSDAFRSFNIEAECAQITCPVLAIQGVDDPYGTMAQIDALKGSLSSENSPQSKYLLLRQLLKLEQCGHSPQRDQAARVISAVTEFLTS
jgi:pimeloyl-ACP methyl ester carboxylesterase